ncbi:hypothetical protein D9C73_013320 [Collichthys lucidus]|uniref:Uncharacterized protein n=1 Tax=Collichthys lucidus TaxID=240159 RepID=A0A4U5UYL0_COLLU|nr:hypothetical protein D9C73_013320 [Collichthys lucidus]
MGKCTFNSAWLDDDEMKRWLKPVANNKYQAFCTLCKKTLELASLGLKALHSHAKSERHQLSVKGLQRVQAITQFCSPSLPGSSSSRDSGCPTPATSSRPSTSSATGTFGSTATLKAEVLWVLNTVTKHQSYRGNEDISELFQTMFPDSDIAKTFTCGKDKTSYIARFGLAKFIKQDLVSKVTGPYVIMFDESLNQTSKKKQLDIHVRFWDDDKVHSRYLGSHFIGHATAQDLLKHFKAGFSMWQMEKLLRAMHTLFNNVPARREDYVTVTKSSVFPLAFCGHRWLENLPVVQRALEVWPFLQLYADAVKKKELPNPGTGSFETIEAAQKDRLILAKLQFFATIARTFQPFLKRYQTDEPAMPFLASDLAELMKSLLRRFVKREVLQDITKLQLTKLDLSEKKNLLLPQKVDIGLGAEKALKESAVSDLRVLEFRSDCMQGLTNIVRKVQEKSPLKYTTVRQMACLDPSNMFRDPDRCKEQMKGLVQTFLQTKQLSGEAWAFCQKLLLLSHGQASVERGFSVNKEVETDNMHEETMVAHRLVCDYVDLHGGVTKVPLTKELLVSVGAARSRYRVFLDQQRARKEGEARTQKRKLAEDYLTDLKKKRTTVQEVCTCLTTEADKLAEEAEGKSGSKMAQLLSKSNALRRASKDKMTELKKVEEEITIKAEELRYM